MYVCNWCFGDMGDFDHDKCLRSIEFVRGHQCDPEQRAPPRESLKALGGPFTLDEFHTYTARDIECLYAPMTIMVKNKEAKRYVRVQGAKLKSLDEL